MELIVTDHAIIRYLERKLGIDMDKLKKEMLPPVLLDSLEQSGYADGRYLLNGFMYVIKDKTLITICHHRKPKNGKKSK